MITKAAVAVAVTVAVTVAVAVAVASLFFCSASDPQVVWLVRQKRLV